MIVLRHIFASFRLIGVALTLVIMLSGYMFTLIFRKHNVENGFKLRRNFVKIVLFILNIKIDVKGEDHRFPAMYIINHRNLIDPVIIARLIDVYFLAKAEIGNYPFLGKGAAITGVIYVIREKKNSRTAARYTLRKTLKKGLNVAVYPEGTTGTEETTTNFFKGSFLEAANLDVPVVPIVLEFRDQSDLWLKPRLLQQFLHQFGKWRTEVKVVIHPAIKSKDGEYLMNESRRLIDRSLIEMHKDWSRVWK